MNDHQKNRALILKALYEAREASPKRGWLFLYQINQVVGEAEFDLAVLDELGLIRVDGMSYRITGQGVLAHEASQSGRV